MKLCIVSTTINGEKGYLEFDRLAAESAFDPIFVISGDKKSKPFDIKKFRCPVEYLDVASQGRFHCSEAIGWNKIMRRNTALLRAIELNPDFILMVDDDNLPDQDYFKNWQKVVSQPCTRLLENDTQSIDSVWHNYLAYADAKIIIYPRGFPIRFRGNKEPDLKFKAVSIANEAIGLYQGVSLGDPDIDAMTRMVYPVELNTLSDKNYCLRNVWSPYNTQNTIFTKEIFPLAFVWPFCGRMDDIYSSFVWQQYLFNKSMYVHIGDSVNVQERGARDNLRDFSNEIEGYLHGDAVFDEIRKIDKTNPVEFIKELTKIDHEVFKRQREFLVSYLNDLESIL